MHFNVKDMSGQRFGKLLIIKYVGIKNEHAYWLCKCDCGNEKEIDGSTIRRGNIKSCGCLREDNSLYNKKFGRLFVIDKSDIKTKNGYYWSCECECGNKILVLGHSLKTGNTQSCGCLQKEMITKQTGESAFRTLYESYKKRSETYNIIFDLSEEDFKKLTKQNCFYCGCEPSQISGKKANGQYIYNGLDKIVPNKGYVINNIVPCCGSCNRSKYTKSQNEFYDWVDKVYSHIHEFNLAKFN